MRLLQPGPERDAPDLRDLYDAPGPYVRAGMLQSADGAVAHDGRSAPLQRPGDGAVFRALRAVADVVLVGAGTARQEGYGPVRLDEEETSWRAARGRRPHVPVAVVSRTLHLGEAQWLEARTLVITCASAAAAARERIGEERVLVAGDTTVDLADALRQLSDRGMPRVLCEGGPTLLADVVAGGLLTELCATLSPVLAGAGPGMLGGPLVAPVDLELVHLLREQDTLLGRWRVRR